MTSCFQVMANKPEIRKSIIVSFLLIVILRGYQGIKKRPLLQSVPCNKSLTISISGGLSNRDDAWKSTEVPATPFCMMIS